MAAARKSAPAAYSTIWEPSEVSLGGILRLLASEDCNSPHPVTHSEALRKGAEGQHLCIFKTGVLVGFKPKMCTTKIIGFTHLFFISSIIHPNSFQLPFYFSI